MGHSISVSSASWQQCEVLDLAVESKSLDGYCFNTQLFRISFKGYNCNSAPSVLLVYPLFICRSVRNQNMYIGVSSSFLFACIPGFDLSPRCCQHLTLINWINEAELLTELAVEECILPEADGEKKQCIQFMAIPLVYGHFLFLREKFCQINSCQMLIKLQ